MRIAAIALFVIGVVAIGTGLIDQRWHQRSTRLILLVHTTQRQAGHVDTFTAPFLTILGGGAIMAAVVLLLVDSAKRRP
jgi:hypothetical protein